MKLLWLSLWTIPSVGAVLENAAIDVVAADGASFTMLVSEAFFGPALAMTPRQNIPRRLLHSPDDNWFLCDNVTQTDQLYADAMLLVPRGTCTFESKTLQAQRLGAAGLLIYGNLGAKYRLNGTAEEANVDDIVFPEAFHDYDCRNGEVWVQDVSFDPLPYNRHTNDLLLSGDVNTNVCRTLTNCESQACLLTGNRSQEGTSWQACCAWDFSIWLPPDMTLESHDVHIPTAYVTLRQGQRLLSDLEQGTLEVTLYRRWQPRYNVSSACIWMLGVVVAAIAAYSSAGDIRRRTARVLRRAARASNATTAATSTSTTETPRTPRPDESLELTAQHAIGFIVLASCSLLFLFYFQPFWLVKFMYGMGCSKAVTNVVFYPLTQLTMKRLDHRDLIICRTGTEDFGDISMRDLIAHTLGYSLGFCWLVMAFAVRHPDQYLFFWMTQNLLGGCMCVLFLQVIKLNSLKVATVLLLIAFFYDIFFVFVTPLLFHGKSVMITVATSGGPPKADYEWCEKYPDNSECQGGDPLPMLLTFPRLFDYAGGMSMLGLGDIVIPGLLVSFAVRYDAAKNLLSTMGSGREGGSSVYACPERKYCGHCGLCNNGYFKPMVVAYAIGLLMANLAVYLMNMGQPALLYLVPSCLGTISFMAWRRGELNDMWDTPKVIRTADRIIYGESADGVAVHAPVPQEEEGGDVPMIPSAVDEET